MGFGTLLGSKEDMHNESSSIGYIYLNKMLTCEESQSFFVSKNNNKIEITNESVKSFVLDKLYNILSVRIAKMDPDYQEIMKSAGNYKRYKHFSSIDECIKELSEILNNNNKNLDTMNKENLTTIFNSHKYLVENSKLFEDAFKYNAGPVKQYYLTIVSSIIYCIGFITTSMIDYERREGSVAYTLIFKNENLIEKNLPKNMMAVLNQFTEDINNNNIKNTVNALKNRKVGTESYSEITNDATYEFGPVATVTLAIAGVIFLPSIIRYIIYFFMHSKIKIAEYIEGQAAFLELNIRSLKRSSTDPNIVKKEQAYVDKLKNLAAKISGDKYIAEKETDKDIKEENKRIISESDKELKDSSNKSSNDNIDDSGILL